MKILFIVPEGDNLGGIITSTENYIQGLREEGHKVEFIYLRQTKKAGKSAPPEGDTSYSVGEGTGMMYSPVFAWRGAYESMLDEDSINRVIIKANAVDFVIWGCLFGLKNKATQGSTRWLRLFSAVNTKQLAIISDDHTDTRNSWIQALEPYLYGWICVQRCTYLTSTILQCHKALILTPIKLDEVVERKIRKRKTKFFSLQTFKRWKRVDRLVSAVPHLDEDSAVVLAGQGIEWNYMTSKYKCRPQYFCTKEVDPLLQGTELEGKRIWDNAIECGMDFRKTITEAERDELLKTSMFLVDFSERDSGGQINRVVVEAMKYGCVPIATNVFLGGCADGNGELFKSGIHYLPVELESTPHETAMQLEGFTAKQVRDVQGFNCELVRNFDRRAVASQIVDFAKRKKMAGFDRNYSTFFEVSPKARLEFEKFFGELPG